MLDRQLTIVSRMKKNISDYQRFNFMNDLIGICAENNLNLSMKVHPVEWQIARDCLEILIGECDQHSRKPKILVGGAIERILDDYDLLVVDMISSRVVSMALRLEIPIIIFLPEGNVVNEHCFADLKNRTYIVKNRQELIELLDIFRENGLHPKLEDEFAEKYFTYPDVNRAISVVHAHVLQGDNR